MLLSIAASVLIAAFAALMIFAAVRDVVAFTIPNWISVGLAGLFIPAALLAGVGWADFGWHVLTAVTVLAIGMAFFAFGWLGGGDAKLLSAAALWMGWPDMLVYAALVAGLGGTFTVLLIGVRRVLGPVAEGYGLSVPILQRSGDIPYGVAIAGGALLFLPKAVIGASLLSAAI